jgi:hypothetical protein
VVGGVLVIAGAVVVGLATGLGPVSWGRLGVLLLAYLGAGIWAWRRRGDEAEAWLRTGGVMGSLLGVAGAVSLTAESLGVLRPPFNAFVPAAEMGTMVLLLGAAAAITLRQSHSVPRALLATLGSAVAGTSLICAYGFFLQLAVLQPRGLGSLGNTVESAVEHLLIVPIVAVLAWAVATTATLVQQASRPAIRFALAVLDVVLGMVGVRLLVVAASLVRAQRPPFVMAGMLLTATALACAPAVLRGFTAIRK